MRQFTYINTYIRMYSQVNNFINAQKTTFFYTVTFPPHFTVNHDYSTRPHAVKNALTYQMQQVGTAGSGTEWNVHKPVPFLIVAYSKQGSGGAQFRWWWGREWKVCTPHFSSQCPRTSEFEGRTAWALFECESECVCVRVSLSLWCGSGLGVML